MSNIIEDLQAANNASDEFAMEESTSDNSRKAMQRAIKNFLDSDSEKKREKNALEVIKEALRHHAKGTKAGPTQRLLNTFEIDNDYPFKKWHRAHMVHQVNTFLVGLLIYSKCKKVRDSINKIINRTTEVLSGGTAKGEFLYRWRVASLLHDIGNIIQLSEDDEKKIKELLDEIKSSLEQSWEKYNGSLESLVRPPIPDKCEFERLDFIEMIGKRNKRNNRFFKDLMEKLIEANGYEKDKDKKTKVYRDHGICSAIIILRILFEDFARNCDHIRKNPESNSNYKDEDKVGYFKEFFFDSMVDSAYAMAVHNVDFYTKFLEEHSIDSPLPYKLEENPLAYLLKISDSLQEWDKPKVIEQNDCHKSSDIEIVVSDDSINILRFPDKNKIENLNEYLKPKIFIFGR